MYLANNDRYIRNLPRGSIQYKELADTLERASLYITSILVIEVRKSITKYHWHNGYAPPRLKERKETQATDITIRFIYREFVVTSNNQANKIEYLVAYAYQTIPRLLRNTRSWRNDG